MDTKLSAETGSRAYISGLKAGWMLTERETLLLNLDSIGSSSSKPFGLQRTSWTRASLYNAEQSCDLYG
jgi:hypothetical protein